MRKSTEARRLARQTEIERRLQDFIDEDPALLAVDLLNTLIAVMAKRYPGQINVAARKKIMENYPEATAALIAERAMSEEGALTAVAGASELARIAIDYNPLSNVEAELRQDDTALARAGEEASETFAGAYRSAIGCGLSAFGAAAMMILIGVHSAKEQGVGGFQLARPLLDALDLALNKGPPELSAEMMRAAEERALDTVSAQLGISREQARKYLITARQGGFAGLSG
jgi:hypothetical protein